MALAVVLAFATTLGPFLFYARRVMVSADDRVAAQVLLRALLAEPVDSAKLASLSRDGASDGLHWHMGAEPSDIDLPRAPTTAAAATAGKAAAQQNWMAYRIVATVTFGGGRSVSAETVRLGKAD